MHMIELWRLNPMQAMRGLFVAIHSSELLRYDEAFAAYDRALAIEPELVGAWVGRGNCFREIEHYAEALGAYDTALSLKADLVQAWLGRGTVFTKLRRHEEAATAYAQALKIDPQHPFTKGILLYDR